MTKAGAYFSILLSLWLISSPLSHGYTDSALLWNDVACGLAVIALGGAVLWKPRLATPAGAAVAFLGLWLMLAPLVFWAKDAVAYSNETLLGVLIALSGGLMLTARDYQLEAQRPRDWTYNPSSWDQRLPIITLAFIGFLTSRYMASYQLGHIDSAWDPFFGDQTMKILESDVSKSFPVSDAGLGAFSYLVDMISGSLGGRQRWRTQPWLVVLFGLLIIPPGVVSITLVVLQPLAVGAWCTLCLFTAVVMLLMVPPAVDEVVATVQYLKRARSEGASLWQSFWKGESELAAHELSSEEKRKHFPPAPLSKISWPLIACTLLGAWIMFMPGALNLESLASDNTYLVGALVVTFAVIAQSEVCRILRFILLALAIWFGASMWFLPGADSTATGIATVTAILLSGFSLPLGPITQHYGTYDKWVRWSPFPKKRPPSSGGRIPTQAA